MLVFVFIFSRFTELSVYPPGPGCFTNVLRHAFVGKGPEWWPVPSINVLLQIVRNTLKIAAVLEVIKGSTRRQL